MNDTPKTGIPGLDAEYKDDHAGESMPDIYPRLRARPPSKILYVRLVNSAQVAIGVCFGLWAFLFTAAFVAGACAVLTAFVLAVSATTGGQ